MTSKQSTKIIALLALFAITLGCGTSSETESDLPQSRQVGPGESATKGVIGFSALTLTNPFFKIIADSLTEAAESHGFVVSIDDADLDVNTQAKHIDSYIARKVVAIVINPADRVAIGPAIKSANEAGIPVFTNDLQCVAEDVEIAGHIGTDNFQGGRLAGQAMIEAVGDGGGKVLILHFAQANSCVLRVRGFYEVIDEYNSEHPDGTMDIVSELDGGGLRDQGFKATSDALQAHPDLDAIFAINDPSALGAVKALEQAGKQGQVTVIGFDGQIEGKQAIKDGLIYADPIQFPVKMGQRTVENIVKYLEGEEFTEMELIPTALYRHADGMKDPELN
jgi:ribose transport system substrate-binding protein